MTAYFSRVRVRPHALDRRLLEAGLAGPAYLDHALIWRLFPGDDERRDFLWRAERDRAGDVCYYVVSQRRPAPAPRDTDLFHIETKPYAPQLAVGDQLQFSLRANPTTTLKRPYGDDELARYNHDRLARGKPAKASHARHQFVDVLMHAKYHGKQAGLDAAALAERMDAAANDWLTRQAASCGLRLQAVTHDGYRPQQLRPGERRIAFSSIDYHGAAEVIDPPRCQQALLQGVGRAKAFGMGLLLIKRLG